MQQECRIGDCRGPVEKEGDKCAECLEIDNRLRRMKEKTDELIIDELREEHKGE